MNFKEICESVLEESDGRGIQITSVALGRDTAGDLYLTEPTHRNIVRWVRDEYEKIQNSSSHWEFHHKRGTFLTLTSGNDEYIKRNVREITNGSLYIIQSGTTAKIPITLQSYDWWLQQERSGTTATGSPLNLIDAPLDKWIVWPTPTTTWTLYADWWIEPGELIAADDEPIWDERYHSLLRWGVIELYAAEFSGEASTGSTPKLLARAARMLPPLRAAFIHDYLPTSRGPDPLI